MPIKVIMPKVDMDMSHGRIAVWHASEGQTITKGEPLFDIETDKATMEVEAPADGALHNITAEGVNVAIGEAVAWLYADGEEVTTAQTEVTPAPVEMPEAAPAEIEAVTQSEPQTPTGKIQATPLARRLAKEAALDLAGITGTGPRGRINRQDIESAILQAAPTTIPAPAQTGGSDLVANSQMRKVIATRLTASKQDAPHFYLSIDCVIDPLLESRKMMAAAAPDAPKISVNDLVVLASAKALMAVPDANASWQGDYTERFHHADIAIAVALEGGLVTPVIWQAETLNLSQISAISRDLGTRARSGDLKREEFTGGSFTISNLGMYGVREFSAVINPPHGAILAVGAGEQRPIVKDGELAVATVMSVTFCCDHRVIDGAVGARWLQSFKGFIENPVTMLL